MAVNMKNMKKQLKSFDDMFGTGTELTTEDDIVKIKIDELHEFNGHAFKIIDDENMDELVESVSVHGVIYPIEVRKIKNGYEIISGHRRTHAAKRAGLTEVPAVIKELDDYHAQLRMVLANKYRSKIFPSEKAKAYLIEMNLLKSIKKERPDGVRSDSELAKTSGDSRASIQRYIRLNNLIEPLLDCVDAETIGVIPAQALCNLPHKYQEKIYAVMVDNNITRLSQDVTEAIHEIYKSTGQLSENDILFGMGLLKQEKPKSIKLSWNQKKLSKYFPPDYSQEQVDSIVEELLNKWAEENGISIEDEAEDNRTIKGQYKVIDTNMNVEQED